jgi:hypothetical protein
MGIILLEGRAQLQHIFVYCNNCALNSPGGLISLLIIIYNHFKQKYNSSQTL